MGLKNDQLCVAGFGNLVTDFVFLKRGRHSELVGADGGGSVFNILSHLSKTYSFQCTALGYVGNDSAGEIALSSLSALGVNADNIEKLNTESRRIHVSIPTDQIFLFDDSITSSMKCPKCGNIYWHSISQRQMKLPDHVVGAGLFIIDSTNKKSLGLAYEARERGLKVVADIGHVSHLRYQSTETLESYLDSLDIVQFNSKVVDFLLKKLGYFGLEKEEVGTLMDSFVLSLNKDLVIITNGERGGFIYAKGGKLKYHYEALTNVKLVDSTGAGDSFFASILNHYMKDARAFLNEVKMERIIEQSLDYVKTVLSSLGARGNLHDLFEVDEKTFCSKKNGVKTLGQTTSPVKVTDTNLNKLVSRILSATTELVQNNFNQFYGELTGNGAVIGTGGSYPVAHFVSNLLSNELQVFTKTLKPFEAVNSDLSIYNFVIAFSYSGGTQDIVEVHKTVSKFPDTDFYLITKANAEDIQAKYQFRENDKVISYAASKRNSKERGFLSFAGTVTPIALFTRSALNISLFSEWENWLKNRFEFWSEHFIQPDIMTQIEQLLRMDYCEIFSDLWSQTTAIDLESKFTESGTIRAMVHEKKDFSHGRFVLSYNKSETFFIFLRTEMHLKYNDELLYYLQNQFGENKVMELRSDERGYLGDFDLLIAAQMLIKQLGKKLDHDITKPSYPKNALKLYKFSKGLSFN